MPIPEIRLRALTASPVRTEGGYVLYWMIASRRLEWSFALDRAIEHANRLGKPLLVFEPLNVTYRWASDRHHQAIIDGMAEHAERLAGTPVGYFPWVEPEPGAGEGLLATLADGACVVVTDDSPVFLTPSLLAAAGRIDGVRIEAVDGCGLLPLRATDKGHYAAYHFRRALQKAIPEHLGTVPSARPLDHLGAPSFERLPDRVVRGWPSATLTLLDGRDGTANSALADLPIDHSVGIAPWTGGGTAARARLVDFIDRDLPRYGENRNDPDAAAASRLSPWLHHGHLSAHEVFHAVAETEGWSPGRLAADANGSRSGWWGMSGSAETFLDELVTWRELGYGYAWHEPDYRRYETLPGWALETLEAHAGDRRAYIYDLETFAAAATHDALWNAAQRELVHDGRIQNYLRMLWGKKIVEWTEHPRDALEVMIELNNRYALDGRDPNSYSGIMWTLGRFDRAWQEREIFGKVRYMTSDSARRKLDLSRYLERWGPASPGG